MAEISALADDGTSRHFSINDGSAANKVEFIMIQHLMKLMGI